MIDPTLSHEIGPAHPPLLDWSIGQALDAAAADYPERDAIVSMHQNLRLSYRDLSAQAKSVGAGLLALGLEPGDRVGIWAPNCAEWAITQYATAYAGLILVNINPAYRTEEVGYALEKVGCKALIFSRTFKTSNYLEMIKEVSPHLFAGDRKESAAPSLRHGILIDDGQAAIPDLHMFSDLARMATPESRAWLDKIAQAQAPEEPINIQFTSGTTGAPKGATLTHRNIINNGYMVGQKIALTKEDRICVPVPLYHCFGMVMGNLAALTHGSAVIYPAASFEPARTLNAVQAEACTALYGVPTMFIGMLADPDFDSFDLSSLRTGIMAGSPCPSETMRRVVNEMNMSEVTICYGMTETSPVSVQSGADATLEQRVSTVGTVHPHLEIKIVDEMGATLPRGETGELCTRGYSVMRGYWGDADATGKAIDQDGWMHTGDLGVMLEDGYVNITGRAKDVVIRGGENIYPREIEEYIMKHEAVSDVQAFGVPDAKFGEVLSAWVILEDGAAHSLSDVEAWLKTRIAHYKIPAYFRQVSEFPMTVTGKAQKFVMRDRMIDELGLTEVKTA